MPNQPVRHSISPQSWAIAAIMFLFWFAVGANMAWTEGRVCDFLCYYSGGSAVLHGHSDTLYDLDVQYRTQRSFFPELSTWVPFIRPPFYAAFFVPAATLPLNASFIIWVVLQTVVFLACVAWACRRWGGRALIFCAIFPYAPLGIASGQDCALVLALIVLMLVLQERSWDFACGALLGLGLAKFHLFLLWPLVLLVQKRWRIILGASVVGVAEALFSLWLVGPAGIARYFSLLRHANINPSQDLMANVHSIALNFGLHRFGLVALLLAASAFAVLLARHSDFRLAVAAGCIGSLLVSPHSYGYDATFLMPSLFFILFQSRSTLAKVLAMTLCSPLPFVTNLAGAPWSVLCPLLLFVLLAVLVYETWKPYQYPPASPASDLVAPAAPG